MLHETKAMKACPSFFNLTFISAFLVLLFGGWLSLADTHAATRPNVIIILADDLGYGDTSEYGCTTQKTPHLERMAAEGMKLTSFYATAPVCSPTRSSIQTGCYYKRVNFDKVILPESRIGLNNDEVTLAEIAKSRGYSTHYLGKWHLGDQKTFLPTFQGYDHYYGHPYSPDMPTIVRYGKPQAKRLTGRGDNQLLPIIQDHWVVGQLGYINPLTKRYTDAALEYITTQAKAGKPFFLFFSHMSVHEPVSPGKAWKGTSQNGKFGDAVQEIDWSTGEIFKRLRELGIDRNTFVVFTSDNGPAPGKGGTAAPLRGTKHTTWEGGVRVNGIFRWPGRIPAGQVSDTLTTVMDLLPTMAHVIGARLPNHKIDGHNIWPILTGQTTRSPYDAFYYYRQSRLVAVRSGKWKLHIQPPDKKEKRLNMLFDLDADIGETTDVAAQHPEVVKNLQALAERARKDMGDDSMGPGVRPIGKVDHPRPFIMPHGIIRPDARPPGS